MFGVLQRSGTQCCLCYTTYVGSPYCVHCLRSSGPPTAAGHVHGLAVQGRPVLRMALRSAAEVQSTAGRLGDVLPSSSGKSQVK